MSPWLLRDPTFLVNLGRPLQLPKTHLDTETSSISKLIRLNSKFAKLSNPNRSQSHNTIKNLIARWSIKPTSSRRLKINYSITKILTRETSITVRSLTPKVQTKGPIVTCKPIYRSYWSQTLLTSNKYQTCSVTRDKAITSQIKWSITS